MNLARMTNQQKQCHCLSPDQPNTDPVLKLPLEAFSANMASYSNGIKINHKPHLKKYYPSLTGLSCQQLNLIRICLLPGASTGTAQTQALHGLLSLKQAWEGARERGLE